MYQDVNPLSPPPPPPPAPAPASYGSSRSGRSGTSAEAVDPFVMVSPPASVTAFPRDVKRRPGLEHGHASQGSSSSLSPSGLEHGKNASASSLATSHRHNASGSSLNLVPTTITSGNGNGRGYEQGPSQPMFQRTKQVASTRRDTVFDLDGGSGGSGQRVRTHSNASSFEMIDPATGLPAIQVSHSARSQPWGVHTFAHAHGYGRNQSAGWPNSAPPVRDRFADDYPSSSSSSGWRR
ncbi:hypothetical protein BKA62DRAFT_767651 [Auriculariales sp. MPI-PUGE-AT-0066]|nr:hypothetical protein BKA62DRAFT_767651 [Auriculariales sp. MPI-PUGE-AT-0066]